MVQLYLPEQKADAVLVTNNRKKYLFSFHFGGNINTSKLVIKYLGIVIGANINFEGHLNYA